MSGPQEPSTHFAPLGSAATEHPSIEALRGLAALLVLVSHYVVFLQPAGAGAWGMAATGVDLFFVLSGFVFTRTLAQPGLAVGPHLVRRAFRLYPLYAVALLLYAALKADGWQWSTLWPHLLMLHTTGDLALAAHYNVAFWSLPPEVEFYLALPVLATGLAALARCTGAALWWLLAAALLMKLGLVGLSQPGEAPDSLRSVLTVHLPGLLVEFLLGSAAAAAAGHVQSNAWGRPLSPFVRRAAAFVGLALLVVAFFAYRTHLATPASAVQAPVWLSGNFGLWVAAAFALMLLVLKPTVSTSGRTHGLPASTGSFMQAVALWAGRLSYGLYLFHNAAPVWVQRWWPGLEGWPLVWSSVLLTTALAGVLHWAVEAPCRAYGRSLASAWQRAINTRMSGDSR